jgi:hypothetical protein
MKKGGGGNRTRDYGHADQVSVARREAKKRELSVAIFHGRLLRSQKISQQNRAILRNAAHVGLVRLTYEKHAVQRYEKLRNSLGLNYESPALTAELQAQFHM